MTNTGLLVASYVKDSLPVIALIPVATAFIGYMISTIEFSLKDIVTDADPYLYFLKIFRLTVFDNHHFTSGLYSIFKQQKLFNYGETKQPETNEGKEKKVENSPGVTGGNLESNIFLYPCL